MKHQPPRSTQTPTKALRSPKRVELYGSTFLVTGLDKIETRIIEKQTYEPSEISLIPPFIIPGTLAVDVGANIGIYSLFMSQFVQPSGKVLAFEPFQVNFERLERNIAANPARHNITAYQQAAGDAAKTIGVRAPREGGNLGGLKLTKGRDLEIQVITLDEVVRPMGRRVSFIKIDVEGWEVRVLKGAKEIISRHKPTVMIEVLDESGDDSSLSHKRQIASFMSERGYRFFRIVRKPLPHLSPLKDIDLEGSVQFNALCIHKNYFDNGYESLAS